MTTHGCGNSPQFIGLFKLLCSVTRRVRVFPLLPVFPRFHRHAAIRTGCSCFTHGRGTCLANRICTNRAKKIGGECFEGCRGDLMKNKLMGKLFRLLGDKLLPLLIQRFQKRPNFAGTKRHKQVSPERAGLPKVIQFLKNRFG